MDTGERLAAYLAGDLDPDEARRLEGELARDPALRLRLTRLRRLEESLSTLPEVEVPTGFPEQLHAALQDELDQRPLARDELAERRRRRGLGALPSWLPAAAGAAAVLVAVVAIGTSLPMGGSDDAADEGAETTAMRTDRADDGAGDAGTAETLMADGPVVRNDGRSYDADEVQALVGAGELQAMAERSLTVAEAAELAERYGAAFDPSGGGDVAAEADEGEAAAESGGAVEAAPLRIEGSEPVHPEELATIEGCLGLILSESDGPLIPVSAELARFDGTDAIVFGMVGHDPGTDAFTRSELWVVGRDTCEVLFFAQGSGG